MDYRQIFIAERGDFPHPCFFCGEPVATLGRKIGVVHHVDEDRSNDAAENLAAAHHSCHVRHHMPPSEMARIGAIGRANGGGEYERTPEIRAKIAESLRGRKATDAHRAAISSGGRAVWERGRAPGGLPKGFKPMKEDCFVCGRPISLSNMSRHVATHF
jgi:hypothetical protein